MLFLRHQPRLRIIAGATGERPLLRGSCKPAGLRSGILPPRDQKRPPKWVVRATESRGYLVTAFIRFTPGYKIAILDHERTHLDSEPARTSSGFTDLKGEYSHPWSVRAHPRSESMRPRSEHRRFSSELARTCMERTHTLPESAGLKEISPLPLRKTACTQHPPG